MKRFIKEGIFPETMGRAINKAFELRQRGDYRENVELSYEQVEPFLSEARSFIAAARSLVELKAT